MPSITEFDFSTKNEWPTAIQFKAHGFSILPGTAKPVQHTNDRLLN